MYLYEKVKVDFMILGAQKCATSTLFDVLRNHPQLIPCKIKEPQFFSHVDNWEKNINDYHKKFDFVQNKKAFEASTSYTFHPAFGKHVWKDLYKYNPDLKFIYIVRDPIDRIVSAHRYLYKRGYIKANDINVELSKGRHLQNVTKYYSQIKPYIELFGKSQVHLVKFEDFNNHRIEIIDRICEFLGVDNFQNYDFVDLKSNSKNRLLFNKKYDHYKMNKFERSIRYLVLKFSFFIKKWRFNRKSKIQLDILDPEMEKLKRELLPEINNLEHISNWDLSTWKDKFYKE